MEKIGLLLELVGKANRDWENYCLLMSSQEQKAQNESLADTLVVLKKIQKSEDITILLGTEKFLLEQDHIKYANSAEETNSIATGLAQLANAQKALVIVNDAGAYQKATETYSDKRKESGLPLDAFREFIKSHNTRLANRLTSSLPVPQKNIIRQRKDNLHKAKELYITLQKQALGLKIQTQELSR